MNILFSENSKKQFKKIAKGNKALAEKIAFAIFEYATANKATNMKELKGKLKGYKRLRVGDYRIILETKEDLLKIYQIRHRKEAYND